MLWGAWLSCCRRWSFTWEEQPFLQGAETFQGSGGGVSGGRGRSRPQTGVPLRPVWGVGVSDAHLYPILGEEGPGVRLRGKLEAGGISPERAAPKEQARGPVLAAAVERRPQEAGGQRAHQRKDEPVRPSRRPPRQSTLRRRSPTRKQCQGTANIKSQSSGDLHAGQKRTNDLCGVTEVMALCKSWEGDSRRFWRRGQLSDRTVGKEAFGVMRCRDRLH